MSQEFYLATALLVVALALPVVPVVLLFAKLDINVDAFIAQAVKLIEAKKEDRLIHMGNRVPAAVVPQGVKGMVLASNAGMRDTVGFYQAFENAIPPLFKLVTKWRLLNILSIALAVLGGLELLRVKTDVPQVLYILAGAVFLVVLVYELKFAKIKRNMKLAKEKIAALLVKNG